jgi:hypothetical protein
MSPPKPSDDVTLIPRKKFQDLETAAYGPSESMFSSADVGMVGEDAREVLLRTIFDAVKSGAPFATSFLQDGQSWTFSSNGDGNLYWSGGDMETVNVERDDLPTDLTFLGSVAKAAVSGARHQRKLELLERSDAKPVKTRVLYGPTITSCCPLVSAAVSRFGRVLLDPKLKTSGLKVLIEEGDRIALPFKDTWVSFPVAGRDQEGFDLSIAWNHRDGFGFADVFVSLPHATAVAADAPDPLPGEEMSGRDPLLIVMPGHSRAIH